MDLSFKADAWEDLDQGGKNLRIQAVDSTGDRHSKSLGQDDFPGGGANQKLTATMMVGDTGDLGEQSGGFVDAGFDPSDVVSVVLFTSQKDQTYLVDNIIVGFGPTATAAGTLPGGTLDATAIGDAYALSLRLEDGDPATVSSVAVWLSDTTWTSGTARPANRIELTFSGSSLVRDAWVEGFEAQGVRFGTVDASAIVQIGSKSPTPGPRNRRSGLTI